jgi:hypothetical protein
MATAVAAADAGGYEPPSWALTGSSEVPPGVEGDRCSPTRACSADLFCYAASDPLDATCTRPCAEPADCDEPTTCVTGFDAPGGGLCLTPRRAVEDPDSRGKHPPDESCSMTARNAVPSSTPLAFSLLALLFLTRRRFVTSNRVDPIPGST